MSDYQIDHLNHRGVSFAPSGSELRATVATPVTAVSTNRTLSDADHARILRCSGNPAITLPTGLMTDFTCTILNDGVGAVVISAGAGATVLPSGSFLLDNTYGLPMTVATVIHVGSGAWRILGTSNEGLLSVNTQTGTSYTLAVSDTGRLITLSNSSAITLTVPLMSSVTLAIGTSVALAQISTGLVTVAPAAGVTVNGVGTNRALSGQWATASLTKISQNGWILSGGLAS
jgi:hypothetical protein